MSADHPLIEAGRFAAVLERAVSDGQVPEEVASAYVAAYLLTLAHSQPAADDLAVFSELVKRATLYARQSVAILGSRQHRAPDSVPDWLQDPGTGPDAA